MYTDNAYTHIHVGHIALDIFRGPIEIVVGLVFGIVSGITLWYIPTKHHVSGQLS